MTHRLLRLSAAALACALLLSGCYREERPVKAPPAAAGVSDRSAAARADAVALNRYEENAFAVSQGKTWFRAYNCNGCHASGGGDSGPPLMDDKWRYGSDPASIFTTIAAGRPNGMPAFGKRIPEDQIWQLVAYVRSMSGQLRTDVAPSRGDTLYPGEPESRREREQPKGEAPPSER